MMKQVLFIILSLSVLLLAQNASQSPGRVEHQMRITDEMIEELSGNIGDQSPEQARQLFEQARSIQEQAWGEFRNGNMPVAKQLTEQARGLVQKAKSASIRKPGKDEKQVMRILEQNNELSEQIGAEISTSSNNDLQNMYSNALELNKDAERMMNKGDFATAYKIAKQAQSIMKKAKKQLSENSNGDKIAQALDKTDEIIGLVADEANGSGAEQVIGIIGISRQFQKQAREAFERGDFRQAAKLTFQAREKAQQAKNLAGSELSSESVSKQIERTRDALDDAASSENSDDNALLIASARAMLDKAQSALDDSNIGSAAKLTNSAKKLAAKILAASNDKPSSASVKKALSMTDKLISQTEPASDNGKQLYEQASNLQRQAQDAFNSGNYSESLKKTRVARELLNKAQNIK